MSETALLPATPIPTSDARPSPTLSHGHSADSIGNTTIAGKGVCQDGETSARCFLQPVTRGLLYSGVEGRVSRAAAMVTGAIAKLRAEELVREAPDVDPLTDLLIDLATGFLGKLAGKAVKALRSKPAATLVELGVGGVFMHESEDKTKEADEGIVGLAVKGATSLAKKGAGNVVNAKDNEEFEADKTETFDYLSMLQNGVFAALDNITTQGFGMLADAERILLYESLGPRYLSPGAVEADISAGLKRYKSSPASKVGRTTVSRHLEKTPDGADIPQAVVHQRKEVRDKKADSVNDIRDTKLVMERIRNTGAPPRLFYYKRDYGSGLANMPGGDALMQTKSTKAQAALDVDAKDEEFVRYKEVEPEFYEMAIANNMKAWGRRWDEMNTADEIAPLMRPTDKSISNAAIVGAVGGVQTPQKKATMLDDNSVINHPILVDSPVMRE